MTMMNHTATVIEPSPNGLEDRFSVIFSKPAVQFVTELVLKFDPELESLYWRRLETKYKLQQYEEHPNFKDSPERHDNQWKVGPLPDCLQNRHLDLGDVSPADIDHFRKALTAQVQGIQVDFDDGHCPTWRNQLLGLSNIYNVVHGLFPDLPCITSLPVLMFRPRAWNMIEHHMMVDGKEVSGTLFDFGFIMYHNALILANKKCGPFFYLSKLEGAKEAKLWNNIFKWTQKRLGLPYGTIKACVLIENILSSFEMDEILYALKDHSLGLNCGIWDYAASFIAKFGYRPNYVLPDRNKYVNMDQKFLQSYMILVIQTCHKRGAHATGGMAALQLSQHNLARDEEVIKRVCYSKLKEIHEGIDGFLVYDVGLVAAINQLWTKCTSSQNQWSVLPKKNITYQELLQVPLGVITTEGLKHNVEVAILFIYHWFLGRGHFQYKGAVEDSATAEISRSQVWQWIRHKALTEDKITITKPLVNDISNEFITSITQNKHICSSQNDCEKIKQAKSVFIELVTKRDFPDFITTYLNEGRIFWYYHDGLKCSI